MTRKTLVALALGGSMLVSTAPIASAAGLGGGPIAAGDLYQPAQYYGDSYGYRDRGYYSDSYDYHPRYRYRDYDDDSYYYRRPYYRQGY